MSIQAALHFISAVRADPELSRRIRELGPGTTLDQLCDLGALSGMEFTAPDLRAAYRIDWSMRMARYVAANPIRQNS